MLRLPRSLTHDVASSVTAAAAQSMQSPRGAGLGSNPLTVDASELEQFDSSALAVLLDCRRQALSAGQSFTVTGVPQRLIQLATLYGVAELISGATPASVRAS
jgi:phospholipid transport system transporter-binding protein